MARRFSSSSSAEGTIGFRLTRAKSGFAICSGNKAGPCREPSRIDNSRKRSFTSRSSNDMNVMIAMRPPFFNKNGASRSIFCNASSSWLTSILIAWNVCLAGCPFLESSLADLACFTHSTRSSVVRNGDWLRRETMFFAMRYASYRVDIHCILLRR